MTEACTLPCLHVFTTNSGLLDEAVVLDVESDDDVASSQLYRPSSLLDKEVILQMASAPSDAWGNDDCSFIEVQKSITREEVMAKCAPLLTQITDQVSHIWTDEFAKDIMKALDDHSIQVLDLQTSKSVIMWATIYDHKYPGANIFSSPGGLIEKLISAKVNVTEVTWTEQTRNLTASSDYALGWNTKRLHLLADQIQNKLTEAEASALRQCANAEMIFVKHLKAQEEARLTRLTKAHKKMEIKLQSCQTMKKSKKGISQVQLRKDLNSLWINVFGSAAEVPPSPGDEDSVSTSTGGLREVELLEDFQFHAGQNRNIYDGKFI